MIHSLESKRSPFKIMLCVFLFKFTLYQGGEFISPISQPLTLTFFQTKALNACPSESTRERLISWLSGVLPHPIGQLPVHKGHYKNLFSKCLLSEVNTRADAFLYV